MSPAGVSAGVRLFHVPGVGARLNLKGWPTPPGRCLPEQAQQGTPPSGGPGGQGQLAKVALSCGQGAPLPKCQKLGKRPGLSHFPARRQAGPPGPRYPLPGSWATSAWSQRALQDLHAEVKAAQVCHNRVLAIFSKNNRSMPPPQTHISLTYKSAVPKFQRQIHTGNATVSLSFPQPNCTSTSPPGDATAQLAQVSGHISSPSPAHWFLKDCSVDSSPMSPSPVLSA